MKQRIDVNGLFVYNRNRRFREIELNRGRGGAAVFGWSSEVVISRLEMAVARPPGRSFGFSILNKANFIWQIKLKSRLPNSHRTAMTRNLYRGFEGVPANCGLARFRETSGCGCKRTGRKHLRGRDGVMLSDDLALE